MKDVLSRIRVEDIEVYKITLMCSKEELISRIENDVALGLRDEDNIKRSLERYDMYESMDTIKVDTTGKEVWKTINQR